MHDPHDAANMASPPPPPRKGWTWTSWVVIILLSSAIAVLTQAREWRGRPIAMDRLDLEMMKISARYLVGAASLFDQKEQLYAKVGVPLNTGPVPRRLRFVVVAGELKGPSEALAQLQELKQRLTRQHLAPTETQEKVLAVLDRLYRAYAAGELTAPSLGEDDRALLRRELEWFGDLALAPDGDPDTGARDAVLAPARRIVVAFMVAFVVLGGLGFVGLVGLLAFVILWFTGTLRSALACGAPHGGVYAETFALWMVLFVGLGVAGSLLPLDGSRLLLSGVGSLLSLVALAWPVWRGVPWAQVRQEIGLTVGRRPWLEPVLGVATYATALPLLGVGALLTVKLMQWQGGAGGGDPADNFGPVRTPTHPIVDEVARAGWWGWLQVLFLASVAAPILEEIMFRGVLYRHLREASCRWRPTASVLASATVVSFVFAVIHPQGWVTVPALMALAFAFALVREWRGSLVPAMVAHGINNAVVTLILVLALGG